MTDRDTMKQHYLWFGLVANSLRQHATDEEWDLLWRFSTSFAVRNDLRVLWEGEDWPDDSKGRWEALK